LQKSGLYLYSFDKFNIVFLCPGLKFAKTKAIKLEQRSRALYLFPPSRLGGGRREKITEKL
jgi:hypothetical protein